MVRVCINGDSLVLEVVGSHKVFALKSEFTIPLSHIRGITHDPGAWEMPVGLRAPGTDLPGVFRAGTFYKDGEKVFWDVRHKENTVVLELVDEDFTRLIVEVDDPNQVVKLVEKALQ